VSAGQWCPYPDIKQTDAPIKKMITNPTAATR
jgi:hypothetical protein